MDADQNVEEKSSGESDDIVLLSPPAKKARMPTISWDSEKIVAALERAYVDKPYAAKKKAEAWVISAATLNAKCPVFMAPNPNIMGANLKSKVENAIASYVGTYLSDIANKSGLDGDVDAESNYSDVMLWAKKIHEEMENIERV
jgi:hypothetical protein